MRHVDQVWMAAAYHLFAGVAFHTGFGFSLLAQQGKSKCIGQGLSSHACLAGQNISVRNLIVLNRLLKMFLYLVMTDDFPENSASQSPHNLSNFKAYQSEV